MKNIFFLLVIVLFAAQEKVQAGKSEPDSLKIISARVEKAGQNLEIDILLDCTGMQIPSNEQLKVQPVLITTTQDTLQFPYLLFPGKIRNKVNMRKERLYGNQEAGTPAYQTVYVVPEDQSQIVYRQTIPFEDWMYGARLVLLQDVYGCADCHRELASIPLQRIALQPKVAYIIPQAVTEEEKQMSLYVHFPWDQAVILTDFMDNARELEKIDRSLTTILNNPNVVLTGISLKGYASPEGAYSYNTRLAARRAAAVERYIRDRYRPTETLLLVESEPEDWQGLRSRVDSSDLKYRMAILDIIDRENNPDARDARLKRLDGNVTYNYLLKNIYPVLRRVDCRLGYTIQEPYTIAEIRDMIRENPGQLSLNELFLAAESYPGGSDEFNEIFVIAAVYYPDNEVVNANRAAAALQQGDLETARMCLGFENAYPEAWNNLGVLLLQEGRTEEAIACFRDACSCGCEEAEYNLQQVMAQTEPTDTNMY